MIHEYKTARSVCGFVEFGAWLGVIVSVILILVAIGTATKGGGYEFALAGLVPALIVLIFSFILVILVQMARATMDGSVAAQKSVIQAQKHHEEMLRSLKDAGGKSAGTPSASSPRSTNEKTTAVGSTNDKGNSSPEPTLASLPAAETLRHNGTSITVLNDEFRVFGIPHKSLEEAKAYIDGLDGQPRQENSGRREPTLAAPKGLA